MHKPGYLLVAVVSDLHAYSEPIANPPSRLNIASHEDQPNLHPLSGLSKLITENNLKADLFLCAGDMGDKANPAATKYAWSKLQEIGNSIKAKSIIATAGNHDMDSRHIHNDYDAKGCLQSLIPPFPGFSDEALCDRYWSRNFAILEAESWRLLVLNSSAYHGAGKAPDEEREHGRVSEKTLSAIKAQLETSKAKSLNMLLCHHHPMRNNGISGKDYSEMEGGDGLLEILGSGDFGQWVVIHGHKHHPRVLYSSGASTSPIIFSAGSLCANLYSELGTRARNQFYLLEFSIDDLPTLGLDIAGEAHAWDWIDANGWQPATLQSGLPSTSGMGCRISSAKTFANELHNQLTSQNAPYFNWTEVVKIKPNLRYIVPNDLKQILNELQKLGATVSYDDHGNISQVGGL
jgi:predicted phosphodiesterase